MKNFLIIFILVSVSVVLIKVGNSDTQFFIEETQNDIDEIATSQDSLFQFADDVLDVVSNKKAVNDSIFIDLDEQVKSKEITIEQQVYQLKQLLRKAEESNKFALEQKNIAQQVKEMSILQKEKSEMARMESEKQYQILLEENELLLKKIKKIKKLKIDTVVISDTLIIDNKKNKKSKKNNDRLHKNLL
jgi:hypothetical protein